jgi:hypothetical protein
MRKASVFLFGVSLAAGSPVEAASPAYDDASDLAYDDGWQTGDAGGMGWGSGWILGNSASGAGHLVGTSTMTGDGDDDMDGDIDTGGRAFGLYAQENGAQANASRLLDGALAPGQSVALDMDHDPSCEPGFRLSNGMGEIRFFFHYGLPPQGYETLDADGFNALGIPGTDEGVHVEVTLTGADSYDLAVTPAGGAMSTFSGTLASSGPITQIYLEQHTSAAVHREAYFNSISVPEPARGVAAAAALAALLRLRHHAASGGRRPATSIPRPHEFGGRSAPR